MKSRPKGFAFLVICGHHEFLLSKEGVTQGDPLAMLLYAIGILPLILKTKDPEKWVQAWYADDSSCISDFHSVLEWFKMISQEGPKFGYFPEPSKCYLVVAPEFVEEAAKVFEGYAVNIVTGHKLLGGFIGDELETEKWLQQKINIWINSIKCIARAAVQQPQTAHVALTKSIQNEWGFYPKSSC